MNHVFEGYPSHLAEQSKTILTFDVDLSIRITGKCGKYQTSGGGFSSGGTLRK